MVASKAIASRLGGRHQDRANREGRDESVPASLTTSQKAQLSRQGAKLAKAFHSLIDARRCEHTAKNLMISAIKARAPGDAATAARLREFAAFYGLRTQQLATHLGVNLAP